MSSKDNFAHGKINNSNYNRNLMKRKTILKTAIGLPAVAAAVLIAFSEPGMADDFLEIAPRPELTEEAIAHDKAMRIIRSEGFFYEDFESMTEGVLTDGWTTTATPGLPGGKWGVGSLGTDGKAMAGTSGYTYAYILGNRDKESTISHDSWLFSPGLYMEAEREYTIEFCTYMGDSPTTGELLGVSVMTSQSPESVMKEMDVIQDSSGTWMLKSYTFTPAESGTYYLGFHCMSPVLANATLIDDVKISEGPTSGFFGLAGVDFGVTDMMKGKVTAEYEVTNRGTEPLELSFKSASPEISVSGLPLTINYRRSESFTVEFTPSKPGKYMGELVIATNDPAHPEVTLIVMGNVMDIPVTDYSYEDFEAGVPKGWEFTTQGINSDYYGGHNASRAFYTRAVYCLSEEGPVGFTTHYVDLGENPEFSFWYKLTDCDLMGVPAGPTPSEIPVMQALISTDNGETYTPVWELGQDSGLRHSPSGDFQQIRIPLTDYAGKRTRIKLEIWGDVNPLEHDFIILVDDVAIGTRPATDLRAVEITGDNCVISGSEAKATVFVENLGLKSVEAYSVTLLDEQGTEVGRSAGSPVEAGGKVPVEIKWASGRNGQIRLHGVVEAEGDANPSNNSSYVLAADMVSADNTKVVIGEGKEYISSSTPLNLASRETASQTLYYANEIGTDGGVISSMSMTGMFTTDHLTESFEVFIKETDREDFSDGGWEDPETFIKVYEGQLFIPAERHEFVIPFDAPYAYKGGNIVVMMRKMSDWFIVGKPLLVHQSPMLRTTFCSYLQRNKMIPSGYEDREAANVYAHLTFNIVKAPSGSVSGTVSDADGPVEGAKVSVDGTQLYAYTDVQGRYELPEVSVGERSLKVTKYGYYPSEGNEAELEEGAVLTKDITLSPYPRITLRGTVTDENGSPVQDVRLYLEGYDDYKAVSDADGNYEIKDIYGDTGMEYTLRTEASWFEPVRKKLALNADTRCDVVVGDSHLRVHNLRTVEENNSLRLEWEAPLAEFKHDNGVPVDYMGWNHGHSECAIFTTYHKHMVVKEIRWYTSNLYGPHANFNVFIFGIDENGYPDPTNILYMARNVDFTDETWNSHILSTPIEVKGCAVGISCDGLLGLGRTAVDEDHPFTPLMHFFSGDSYKYEMGISDFTSFMECHPMLRLGGDYIADLEDNSRKAITRPNCTYEAYRTRLTAAGWTQRTFIGSTADLGLEDMEFSSLPDGKYRYSVTARYATGDSDEVHSGVVSKSGSGIDNVAADGFGISYDASAHELILAGNAVMIEITGVDGVCVMRMDTPSGAISLDGLAEGMYVVRALFDDNTVSTLKFIR